MRLLMSTHMLRMLMVGLLSVSAVGFVAGLAVERLGKSDVHDGEPAGTATHEEGATEAAETGGTASEERVFGFNPEGPLPVTVAVVISAVLVAALLRGARLDVVVPVAAAFALAFGVLDFVELGHQAGERAGLAGVAGVIGAIHIAAVGVAVLLWRRRVA